jgi:hypothetical protein
MSCDPNALIEEAKCLNACIPYGMIPAVQAALLCQIASAGIPGAAEIAAVDGWSMEFFDDYEVGADPVLDKGLGWDGAAAGSGLSIVERTVYTGKTEKRLSILGGQYGRTMHFGAFWNRIQICLLMRINGAAGPITSDHYIGLCSGLTNMVASATTANFIGEQAQTAWSHNIGTKANYFQRASASQFVNRRGTTTTTTGGLSGAHQVNYASTEGYRSMIFIELSRPVFATPATLVSYSYGQCAMTNTMVQFSFAKRAVMDALYTNPVPSGLASANGTQIFDTSNQTNNVNFDESTGALDTFNISWPNASVPFEIAAIAIRKVR